MAPAAEEAERGNASERGSCSARRGLGVESIPMHWPWQAAGEGTFRCGIGVGSGGSCGPRIEQEAALDEVTSAGLVSGGELRRRHGFVWRTGLKLELE